MKHLPKQFGLDAIYGIDFETIWGDDFTLKKLPTTEYICDPRFGVHCVSVQKLGWAKPKVMDPLQFKAFVWSVRGQRVGMLAHHCLPGDVEVLTPEGWVPLRESRDTATIMQWDPVTERLSWAENAPKVSRHAETLLKWDTSFHKCAYTPEHRMVFDTPRVNRWRFETAAEVSARQPNGVYIPLAGKYVEESSPLDTTPVEAELIEAIRADGSWIIGASSDKCFGARFKLRKQRKISRLRGLCRLLRLPVSETVDSGGNTNIRITTCGFTDYAYSLLGRAKSYGMWVLRLPYEAREAILKAAKFWDGSVKQGGRGYVWACADEATVDAFQLLAHTTGWSVSGAWRNNERGYTKNKPGAKLYIATVRRKARAKLVERAVEIPHNATVYCYTVPTGALLVRSNNRVLVTGNCQFDALIASRHFDFKPAFYFDTLSMARMLMPVHVGGSLMAVCQAFGRQSKLKGQALLNTKNKTTLTKAEYRALAAYAGDDIEDCWYIFEKMLPFVPESELKLIDQTIKMYAQPTLLLDKKLLLELEHKTLARKAEIMSKIEADRSQLMSNDKFAELLRAHGCEPPTKISKTTGKETYAFSKQDLEFKALLEHEDEMVAALVEARLGVKSTIVETRAARMAKRADYGPQPIYLNFAGAKTGRWSGGDSINWQNMSARGSGADMRKAILAPPGHSLIIADLAQIEARLNAWHAGQQNIVDAFANGDDVYKLVASRIYGKPVDKITKEERFVGKCCVLALGYGAGWSRFADMLRVGALGPPIQITDSLARDVHSAWRQANPFICASWKRANNNAKSAFIGRQRIDEGVLTYEGFDGKGVTHLPGGTCIRYDKLQVDEEGMSYASKWRMTKNGVTELRQRLYGGLIVENNTQALARRVIADHIVQMTDEFKQARLAMTTHDEVVLVVPTRSAKKVLKGVEKIMSTPPTWAKDLPLAVEAHISQRYDK